MNEPEQETKQELIKRAKDLPPTERFTLQPRTFEEAFRYANLIAESTLIPKEFQKSPSNVLIAVQYGMELGVTPMQALQSMYVVNGRPSIYGDLLPALILQSGLCEQFDEQYDEEKRVATCTVKRKGFAAITRTFSWEDAKRAKAYEGGRVIPLAEKQTYQSYPQRMLPMRARSWACRDMFADVLKGLAIREEQEDFVNAPIETTATAVPQDRIEAPKVREKPIETTATKGEPDASKSKGDAVPRSGGTQARSEAARPGREAKHGSESAGGEDGQGDRGAQEAAKAPAEPADAAIPLKVELLAWIQTASSEALHSTDKKVNRIYAECTAARIPDVKDRQAVLSAFDEERRSRPAPKSDG